MAVLSALAFNSRGEIGGERRDLGEAGVALPNLRPQMTGNDLLVKGVAGLLSVPGSFCLP